MGVTLEIHRHLTNWDTQIWGLRLRDDVEEWLTERDMIFWSTMTTDNSRSPFTKVFWLEFKDEKEAMLFKLTWL